MEMFNQSGVCVCVQLYSSNTLTSAFKEQKCTRKTPSGWNTGSVVFAHQSIEHTTGEGEAQQSTSLNLTPSLYGISFSLLRVLYMCLSSCSTVRVRPRVSEHLHMSVTKLIGTV